MARRSFAVVVAALLVMSQVATALGAGAPGAASPAGLVAARVEPGLLGELEAGRATRFVVEFAGKAALGGAGKLPAKAQKGRFVVDALMATANRAQAEAARLARGVKGVRYTTYWLTNVAVVDAAPGAGKSATDLARLIAPLNGVTAVRAERTYPLVRPIDGARPVRPAVDADGLAPEWGVARIGAPAAWADGVNGAGIVVANIDTGVDYLHPALTAQYRGTLAGGGFNHDFAWFDPTGICGTEPCDNAQHGTHTMGTMVGGDGAGPYTPDTGVAPGATWIAAKGCEDFGCSEQALLASGQWILAPTPAGVGEGDPSKAPDIVNNSWGSGPGDTFYLETVQAWRAAGIIPVFSSGNPGPFCGAGGSPGDFLESLSAGATDIDDVIAAFSGRGPSAYKEINPDVSAPGVNVTSTIPGGGFAAFSGTSMAAPHVAGTLALMLQADAALRGDFDAAATFLKQTALDRIDKSCGGDEDGDPNNVYGDGRIDAALAVETVKDGGMLAGTVTDSESGDPIAGARVVASDGSRRFPATTKEDGTYSIFLAPGSYGVSFDAFGYFGTVVNPVVIVTDETTVQNAALVPLPRFTVSGTVTAAENGDPIEGTKVAVLGTPVRPVLTNAAGEYSVELPIGTYTLRFTARGCAESVDVPDVTGTFEDDDQVVSVQLVRKLDNFGHGCAPIAFEWVDAQSQTALWGDEIGGRLRLPFPFPFYGETYEEIWIAENGYVNFLDFSAGEFIPRSIPSASFPNAAVYPLWQDLWIVKGGIDYELIEVGGKKAFVIEYGVEAYGTSTHLDVEIKLWEDGTIDFLYGNNSSVANGGQATVGIENATGRDALRIAYLEPVLERNSALRIERVPTGLISGTVTDANDGLPVVGATVTAQPGNRSTQTGVDGTYQLRVRPGLYAVTISADGYVSQTTHFVGIAVDDVEVIDAALAAPTAAVDPASIVQSLDFGETTTLDVTLSNGGSAPLLWEVKERSLGTTPVPLPEPGVSARRAPAWKKQQLPAGVTVSPVRTSALEDLPIIVSDPPDDSFGNLELTAIRALSDGVAANIGLEYAPGTNVAQNGGFVFLDIDQDPATGEPAEFFFGLPSQDLGLEYWAELFNLSDPEPVVPVYSVETFELVALVPAEITANGVVFGIPLEAIGGDDGFINTGLVTGLFGPEDWAPDVGHGTIESFSDVPWLSADPESGETAAGDSSIVQMTIGSPDLEPGSHEAKVVFATNAPRTRFVEVDVTLDVAMPDEFGAITGAVTDAHHGMPINGASVVLHAEWPAGTARDFVATTKADGSFRIVGPEGTWPVDVSADGYVPASIETTITRGVSTPGVEAQLHLDIAHAEVLGGEIRAIVKPDGTYTTTLTIGNPGGHQPLDFEMREVDLAGAGVTPAPGTEARPRALPAGANRNATTTKGIFSNTAARVPPGVKDTGGGGGVLAAWPALGLDLPWGVGYDGTVWISDPLEGNNLCSSGGKCVNAQYDVDGNPLGQVPAAWAGAWNADMAFDPGTGRMWQVNVGGNNGIVGWDRETGEALQTITGNPWDDTSQRGLAYDPANDVFYVGGWNQGIVYRVAGPGHATPGETLSQCSPEDPNISGLAWNPSFELLWVATNSESDAIYLVDPTTCETQNVIGHPDGGGFGGAGLEMDVVGNLWTVGQGSGTVYLLESGVPNFSDVPWLSASPEAGTVEPDESQDVEISIDATGLDVGVHRALVVVTTNDPENKFISLPVTLIVTDYLTALNAGGAAYTDIHSQVWTADQRWRSGAEDSAGHFGGGGPRSTRQPIDGTDDDPLFQHLREAMDGYRFSTLPEGLYEVKILLADIKPKRPSANVFDVIVEGVPVHSDLDVAALAGGQNSAVVLTFVVEVTDGRLDVTFNPDAGDQAFVNAIRVARLPGFGGE